MWNLLVRSRFLEPFPAALESEWQPVLVRHSKGYNFAIPRRAADIFGADDVAKRFSRWQQVLNASTCAKSTEQNRAPICTG